MFISRIKMSQKGDLSDLDSGMVVVARQSADKNCRHCGNCGEQNSIPEHNTFYSRFTSVSQEQEPEATLGTSLSKLDR